MYLTNAIIIPFLPFQRVKAFVVFQLFIEKLSEEAKHKFFRYLCNAAFSTSVLYIHIVYEYIWQNMYYTVVNTVEC